MDLEEFGTEIQGLLKRLDEVDASIASTSPVSSDWDELLREKNTIRIKLKAVQIRLEYLGKLHLFAKEFQTIPKF